jgi:crotonobetainyl-CoA:carnitine CoA-transferase CaiB-like acyl-CoA transferase
MTQPFAGLRILDFTQVLAGPFATQQLALLGAEVIKVEPPGTGDQTRTLMNGGPVAPPGMAPSFLSCNLGKRSLCLDLKAPAAAGIVRRLVARSDVVVENFRPGVMQRLGFGYDALRAARPDLVYCSISGYGQQGPRAGVAAYDGAIQADSGMMSINGHPATGPTRTGYMPVDMATALNSAFAIAAALYRRLATGLGQYIDVAMMDTAVVLQTPQYSNTLVNGDAPGLIGNRSPTGQPTASVFATADGHLQVVALSETQVQALFARLGCPERLAEPAFATVVARIAHHDAVRDLVAARMRLRSTADWTAELTAAGVPVAPIRSIPDVVDDPQFTHRGIFREQTIAPGAPPVRLVHAGFVTDADGPQGSRPAPRLGEHSHEILTELGYEPAEIRALAEARVI